MQEDQALIKTNKWLQ